jgi:hypothetical protein
MSCSSWWFALSRRVTLRLSSSPVFGSSPPHPLRATCIRLCSPIYLFFSHVLGEFRAGIKRTRPSSASRGLGVAYAHMIRYASCRFSEASGRWGLDGSTSLCSFCFPSFSPFCHVSASFRVPVFRPVQPVAASVCDRSSQAARSAPLSNLSCH